MNEWKAEKPFEYLRRKENGERFGTEIVKGWYIARAYVLRQLTENHPCFAPNSNAHLQVVLDGDSAEMLFVARQVALSAHYVNFDDEDEQRRHRTVISIVSHRPDIKAELEKEEYLCNLPKYAKFVDSEGVSEHSDSYLDIEIHILKEAPAETGAHTLLFRQEEVAAFFEQSQEDESVLGIDTRKAIYASRMYDIGVDIHNLPAEDIHCTKRYAKALDIFQYEELEKPLQPMVVAAQWEQMSLSRIKENISNILCADCFALRRNSIAPCHHAKDKKGEREAMALWEAHNEALSKSEHARWNVEKLVMGYRPFSEQERFEDNLLHVQQKGRKKAFRDGLKRNDADPAHIDICSYRDLRRVNPDDLKYDSFLMLAIPKILAKIEN